MDYKSILLNYIYEADASAGSIVYQPCDGLLEVCESEDEKQHLLSIVGQSTIAKMTDRDNSVYQELIEWSKDDLLLESSKGYLFCIPQKLAFAS